MTEGTGRTGQAEWDLNRTDKVIRQSRAGEQDMRNRTGGTGQAKQDRRKRTGGTGQAKQDRRNRIDKIRHYQRSIQL